ncbi:low density lipoprotein receptor adapter protein 1-like [Hetaerina americana]|uniref:low density lipoprotein receptor adapter protein 1-like n=1 Tax=Hetaerina americana TaxID=62018 RepID=UPI003A7F236D
MTSFLRGLLKGKKSKHKKLLEEWTSSDKEDEVEEVKAKEAPKTPGSSEGDIVETDTNTTFSVKYMGSSIVESPKGESSTANAIKAVIALSKISGKKLRRVILSITLRGIKVVDSATNEVQFDISIYRISYCSADAAFNHVFAFIATNDNETMECHAFLCRKRKLAVSATLAIARMFNRAYEMWQSSRSAAPPRPDPPTAENEPPSTNENSDEESKEDVAGKLVIYVQAEVHAENETFSENEENLLIDFTEEVELLKNNDPWVIFDEDDDLPIKRSENGALAANENDTSSSEGIEDDFDLLSLP